MFWIVINLERGWVWDTLREWIVRKGLRTSVQHFNGFIFLKIKQQRAVMKKLIIFKCRKCTQSQPVLWVIWAFLSVLQLLFPVVGTHVIIRNRFHIMHAPFVFTFCNEFSSFGFTAVVVQLSTPAINRSDYMLCSDVGEVAARTRGVWFLSIYEYKLEWCKLLVAVKGSDPPKHNLFKFIWTLFSILKIITGEFMSIHVSVLTYLPPGNNFVRSKCVYWLV
jgi:hypothetical protein